MARMRRRNTKGAPPGFWLGLIRTYRPGFAQLSEQKRVPRVAALARRGLSARNIGRVVDVSKSTILGISWRTRRRKRNRVRLMGNLPRHRALNDRLRMLPRYSGRYH